MPSIVVPTGFSFVIGTVISTAWLNTWQMFRVIGARKAANIEYPRFYAEKSEAESSPEAMHFNCVQRAHQHTVENTPQFLVSVVVTGSKYPYLAAGLGAGWLLGRILYTITYNAQGPQRRKLSAYSQLALMLTGTYTAFEFIRDAL